MNQDPRKPIMSRPQPLKKRATKSAEQMKPVSVPVPKPAVDRAQVEALLDKARIEQQNNAACRALIDANERLCNQVFELASMMNLEQSADAPVPAAEMKHEPEIPVVSADQPDLRKLPIAKLKGYHRAPEYKLRREEIMQSLVGMYAGLGGKLNALECAKLLNCSENTVYKYSKIIREARKLASASPN